MARTETGGPVFPQLNYEITDKGPATYTSDTGISLRDYFAGQALASLSSSLEAEQAAVWAYKLADAMLLARTQDPEK
jgi:hypothetical protein